MGQPEQFVKQLFQEETSALTGGAAEWGGPVELGLSEVRLDGLLRLLAPERLAALAAPWSLAGEGGEVVLEVKLAGDHLDRVAVERARLRRQAYEVRRLEAAEASGAAGAAAGHVPLWLAAPHVPRWLGAGAAVAPGCYELGPGPFRFVWVAANELPLRDELIPFLVARSGAALAEFVRWVAERRPWALVLRMIQFLPMTPAVREELERYFPETDDPQVRERQRFIVQMLLNKNPETKQALLGEAREEGREKGREQECERLYERRLGRALSEGERAVLRERWGRLSEDRLLDLALDSSAEAL
nr:hypothetical protein [Polyangiaceae bacterium]